MQSGHRFDFHGACDLVLEHASDIGGSGLDLDLHLRTTIRYQYSYISTAALRIGSDILQVTKWGEYNLNWDASASMPNVIGGYNVSYIQINEKEHAFEVDLGNNERIVLSTFKDWVNVKIGSNSGGVFENSRGLMGDFSGSMLARDGKTLMEDPIAFGQEWQVLDTEPKLFLTDRSPQHPLACELPSLAQQSRRRLGSTIARAEAEQACAHWKEDQDACVFDVMATGDIEIATAGVY